MTVTLSHLKYLPDINERDLCPIMALDVIRKEQCCLLVLPGSHSKTIQGFRISLDFSSIT